MDLGEVGVGVGDNPLLDLRPFPGKCVFFLFEGKMKECNTAGAVI